MVSTFFLGFLISRVKFCTLNLLSKKGTVGIIFLFSGGLSVAWVQAAFSYQLNDSTAIKASLPTMYTFLGGLMFGLGMTVNGACEISTINRIANGELYRVASVLGWLIVIFIFPESSFLIDEGKDINVSYFYRNLLSLFIFVLIISYLLDLNGLDDLKSHYHWISIYIIALLIAAPTAYDPSWVPTLYFNDIAQGFNVDFGHLPSFGASVLFLSLIVGMFISSLVKENFSFDYGSINQWIKCFLGGLTMGFGADIASGGNIIQVHGGLPNLSPSSIVFVFSMLVGILIGIKFFALHKWGNYSVSAKAANKRKPL